MEQLQSTWRWLITETSVADKQVLFAGVVDYIRARNATIAELLTRGTSRTARTGRCCRECVLKGWAI